MSYNASKHTIDSMLLFFNSLLKVPIIRTKGNSSRRFFQLSV